MYTIGKVATRTGVGADTLHHYERERLIAPAAKSVPGYRQCEDEAAHRVRFIKRAQDCGFTLAESRELVTPEVAEGARCGHARGLAIGTRPRIARMPRAPQAMVRALDDLIERCAGGNLPTVDRFGAILSSVG